MIDVSTPVQTSIMENGECFNAVTDIKRTISSADIKNNSVEVVTLRRTKEGFGLKFVGGTDSQHLPGEDGFFISHISPGGVAESSEKLVPGDEIVAINNVAIIGRTHDEVVKMFKESEEYVTLIVDHIAEARILKPVEKTLTFMTNLTGAKVTLKTGSAPFTSLLNSRTASPIDQAKVATPAISEESLTDVPVQVNGTVMRESVDSTGAVDIVQSTPTKAAFRNYLHATSSFSSQKAEADSTTWPQSSTKGSERDEDEMSTMTDASSHYYNDDIPPTPRRPYSLLDGESPYAGIFYGCVGAGVIILVGYLVVKRLAKRGQQH